MGYVNTTAYTTKASRTLSSKSEKKKEKMSVTNNNKKMRRTVNYLSAAYLPSDIEMDCNVFSLFCMEVSCETIGK